eukprot:12421335-Karenia_brevis.AAC.1
MVMLLRRQRRDDDGNDGDGHHHHCRHHHHHHHHPPHDFIIIILLIIIIAAIMHTKKDQCSEHWQLPLGLFKTTAHATTLELFPKLHELPPLGGVLNWKARRDVLIS